jgi:hypothetical protein
MREQIYYLWRDEYNCRHFQVKGTHQDFRVDGWRWRDDGRLQVHVYDEVNRKYRRGNFSPSHPLVHIIFKERGEHE